jgi:Spy/CpxP family protein refolding chaperone
MNMVRKALGIGVIGVLATLMVVSLATAQPGGGGGPGGGGMGGGMGMRGGGMGMVTQESLGATEAEWKVLEPKVTKVQTLTQQLSSRGGRGMRGGPGADTGAAAPAPSDVQKARTALTDLVGPNATGTPTADQISKALTAYRSARQKAQAELTTAQADLKKVVTPKQEALCVLAGILD